jgi:hypothetical protein
MTRRWSRPTLIAGIATIALWIAPQAGATVTTSNVTSPTDPTYALSDDDNPNSITISGTSDGTTGDHVDVYCYFGTTPFRLQAALNLAVQGDGSFSGTGPLSNLTDTACRLHAVPAGAEPSNLTPFSGPRVATGERLSTPIGAGPNAGTIHDFYAYGQQLTAADDYDSYGSCGLCDGYLFDSNFTKTTTTWFRNDFFGSENGSVTRSAVQVDGVNSYSSDSADGINDAAGNFPPLTWNVTQNPSNGNLTITESEALVRCPDATFPPDATSCPSFVNTGVRVDRNITQEQDGHLVFITDHYVSTDGHDHSLSLLPFNSQFFGNSGPDVAYKFPGESSPSTHTVNDSVSFPDSSPGAVYVSVQGATDGDTDTGQGAIVFDRPASPAEFSDVDGNELEFHQSGLATPTCSPSFSFAYAQDYLAANVATLAQTALDRFNASPATTCSPTPPPTPNPTPTTTARRAAALKKCKKKKSAKARKKCRKRAKKLPV